MDSKNTSYYMPEHPTIGRFAPSSTGPLHFGSLVCAFTSFLMAKRNNGQWLLRIEDIDLERCDSIHAQSILHSLENHGLYWDTEVVYQTNRQDIYEQYLQRLNQSGFLYGCACSRKQIKARSEYYDQYCRYRQLPLTSHVVRFINDGSISAFADELAGEVSIDSHLCVEDPVLRRADGTIAYHLAAIADDIEQGVTQVVRGMDLLDVTPLHMQIYKSLSHSVPSYAHMPVAVHALGKKFAKQSYSPAIDHAHAAENLLTCLEFMGVAVNDLPDSNNVNEIITWSINEWQPAFMPMKSEIIVSESNGLYSVVNS